MYGDEHPRRTSDCDVLYYTAVMIHILGVVSLAERITEGFEAHHTT